MELKEAMRVQTQCWSVNISVIAKIGTDIINDAGRQAAHEKQRKYTFYVLKVNINFQRKKKKR
jgi:hypothetical protein